MANYTMNGSENNTYQAAFFIVPSHILDLPGLTLKFLRVYEIIFQFWNHKRQCFLSDDSLMQRASIGQSQLYEAFVFFEKHGELVRRKINGKRYFVKPESSIEHHCSGNEPTSGGAEPEFRRSGSSTSGGAEHNMKNINKENKTTTEQPHEISSVKSDYCDEHAHNNQTKRLGREQEPNHDSITEAPDVVVFESPNQDKYVLNKIKDAPNENKPEYSTVKFLKEIKYHIEKHYPDNFHQGVNAVAKLLRKHKWSTPAGYVDIDAENARKTENNRLYKERMKAQEEMSEQKRKELYSALKRAKNEIIKRPVATKAFSSAIKSMYDVLGASRMIKNTESCVSVFAQAS